MIDAYILAADGERRPIRHRDNALVIRRDKMEMEPDGPVAIHLRHAWVLDGKRYLVTKIASRVTLRLESDDAGRTFGPFDKLWTLDGLIVADLDQGDPLAAFQPDGRVWRCTADGTLWDNVVFTEA